MTEQALPVCPKCGEGNLRRVRRARRRWSCVGCRWQGPDPRTSMRVTDAPGYETTALLPKMAEYTGSDNTMGGLG